MIPNEINKLVTSCMQGIWSDDVASWENCNDISRCVNK